MQKEMYKINFIKNILYVTEQDITYFQHRNRKKCAIRVMNLLWSKDIRWITGIRTESKYRSKTNNAFRVSGGRRVSKGRIPVDSFWTLLSNKLPLSK